ncbi:hypothetical protein OTU49_008002 [Cherax quadricarinatus]|uniref:Fanconi Anaemia group E protein C-terminal domain-containing protein n=1 Tax=Cherax quadricarinatus TaxID=27406 RepID=A0AAW0WDY6_CHEQU|nr:uncharacterized protein LOC128699958 [Cherax quadricarinatus]XP_053648772.1 uncharacterized protein LOC128699958 [Cherax quadricarinatus]
MWEDYNVSEKNKKTFEELCKKFRQSPGVFECKHAEMRLHEMNTEQDAQIDENQTPKKIKLDTSHTMPVKTSHVEELKSSMIPDVQIMQNSILNALNNSEKVNTELYKSVEPLSVCNSSAPVISDAVLFNVCKKNENSDDAVAAIVGTLFILPKLYHLSSKLSKPNVDALLEFLEWHTDVSVTHILVPLLQHCPKTEEQHRDVLARLVSAFSTQHITQMLSALSSRESVSDVDVQIFQLLCENADHQASTAHTAVLAFLNKTADKYKTFIKFGQCLLFVIKKMGQYIQDYESLQLIANSHSSSMKKAIELQMKKAMKNR